MSVYKKHFDLESNLNLEKTTEFDANVTFCTNVGKKSLHHWNPIPPQKKTRQTTRWPLNGYQDFEIKR